MEDEFGKVQPNVANTLSSCHTKLARALNKAMLETIKKVINFKSSLSIYWFCDVGSIDRDISSTS